MRKLFATGLLLAVLAPVWAGTVQPASAAAGTCDGVWVVVDFGALGGGISTKCATSYGTGTKALRSAGFDPTITDGFIYKIDGKPSKPDTSKEYWSYWHATKQDDGSYSGWSYSNLGANGYHPRKGNAEGWRYQGANGKVPPGARPPKAEPSTPSPTATKTSKPTASPTATKKPTATAKPTATRTTAKPTATKKPTASRTPTTSPSATTTPSPTATTVTPTSAPTTEPPTIPPDPTPPAQPDTATAVAETTDTAPQPDTGSPLGVIVAGGLILAGGAGAGGWWWLKGRKR